MSVRVTINALILLVAAAALGILLYIICNLQKVMTKILNTGLVVMKQNQSKIENSIQPLVNDVGNNFANEMLDNKSLITKATNVITTQTNLTLNNKDFDASLSALSKRITNDVVNDGGVQTDVGKLIQSSPVRNAIATAIKNPPVTDAISESIVNALGGGNDLGPNKLNASDTPTAFEKALITNISQPAVADALGKAVQQFPQTVTPIPGAFKPKPLGPLGPLGPGPVIPTSSHGWANIKGGPKPVVPRAQQSLAARNTGYAVRM